MITIIVFRRIMNPHLEKVFYMLLPVKQHATIYKCTLVSKNTVCFLCSSFSPPKEVCSSLFHNKECSINFIWRLFSLTLVADAVSLGYWVWAFYQNSWSLPYKLRCSVPLESQNGQKSAGPRGGRNIIRVSWNHGSHTLHFFFFFALDFDSFYTLNV